MSASEWIKWHGGECPVHPTRRVDVIYLSNARQTVRAGSVSWRHKRRLSDIDYYRLSEIAA